MKDLLTQAETAESSVTATTEGTVHARRRNLTVVQPTSAAPAEDDEPAIPLDDEPDVPLEDDEPAIPVEAPADGTAKPPAPVGVTPSGPNGGDSGQPAALAPLPLMEVLPADFPLPLLARFVPDLRLKQQADEAARYALSVEVHGPEGLQTADVALTALREAQKGITAHFEEPAAIAHRLHKAITGIRSEWLEPGEAAVKLVGRKVYVEQQRLAALAAEERRKAQAEADRIAREEARRRAEAAEKAQAPKAVVENLQQQAKTAQAPPVATPTTVAPPKLAGTSVVKTWKARIAGTPADEEPNPKIAELSVEQRLAVFKLVVNVAAQLARDLQLTLEPDYLSKCPGAPITALEFNWKVLNDRAKSDKSTFSIPGLEAFEEGGTRAKSSRSR